MKKCSVVIATAIAVTLFGPCALADDASASMEGLRAVRDKETGKLRAPNNDELKQMIAAEKASRKAQGQVAESTDAQPVEVRTYSDGMKAAVLGPEFLVSLEARRDADGNLIVSHSRPEYDGHAEPAATELPTE